jgi:hypothetical protein
MVIVIAFLGILFMAGRSMIDTDTWWHLRTGQWIAEHHALPEVDRFSYTKVGATWYYPGWLSEILMFGVFSLGGLSALNLLFTVLIVSTFIVVYFTLQGNPYLRAFVLILAAGESRIYWSARPQVFTFFLAALFFLVIWRYLHDGKNHLWVLPVAMVFWVNLHGGFAVGFIFLFAAIAGQGIKYLLVNGSRTAETLRSIFWLCGIGIACLMTSALNPYGFKILAYPFQTVSIQFLQNYIQEWQSPNFHYLQSQFFLILLFMTWTVIAFSPRKFDPGDFTVLAIISYMGFLAWRNTNLLSIVAPAIIMHYGQPILEMRFPGWNPSEIVSRLQSWLHSAIILCLTLAVLAFMVVSNTSKAIWTGIERQIPVDAVEYLNQHPGLGRLFNSYDWGSYLLWSLPSYPVFVDGRTDLYDDVILNQYLTLAAALPGWQDVLEKWDIQVILLEPDSPILQILISEGWEICYSDPQAVIIHRPDH